MNPDIKNLRHFAMGTGFFFVVVFGLFFPFVFKYPLPHWPWVVCGVLWIGGISAPRFLGPIYHLWMKIVSVLGKLNTAIIIGIIFYFIVTPCALLMRITAKDAMNRKFDKKLKSYRKRNPRISSAHFDHPF